MPKKSKKYNFKKRLYKSIRALKQELWAFSCLPKFHWIYFLIFLLFSHEFLAKNWKKANFRALGPWGPRGPKDDFFYKKGFLLFLSFFVVEKISASYFKMPSLWALYSIILISHGPPWRRVDHTVTLLTSVTLVTSPLDLSG